MYSNKEKFGILEHNLKPPHSSSESRTSQILAIEVAPNWKELNSLKKSGNIKISTHKCLKEVVSLFWENIKVLYIKQDVISNCWIIACGAIL